jgi:hypothetical protein
MKIAFGFYGILYGLGGRTGSARDFRHCWPNINRMLVQPFVDQGHEVKTYFSSYKFTDEEIEKEFYELVNPDAVLLNDIEGSDPFTAKYALFDLLDNDESDVIIFTRSDVHWSKVIANQDIDFSKFNFLFPEKEWWQTQFKFTCDNFYVWPSKMTPIVRKAMYETYGFPRGKPLVDTHALMVKLEQYISSDDIHLISKEEELSDVNTFYTCCRSGLPDRECMHEEVRDRYEKENWSYYNWWRKV